VVRFDLDDFKAVNKYGHLAGDNVLQQVGKILQEHSRPGDYPLHNSGDEFGFVLVDVKPGEAETLEETVTKIIARYVDEIEKGVIRPDGKTQRISPGFRIVGKDEHGGFETFDGQADLAGEKSKEFKYDMDDKGNRITTAGSTRIINFETMHTVESKLSHGTRRSLAIEESIQREFQATIDALEKKVADGSITKEELEKLIATKELFLHVVRKAVDSKPPEKTSPVMEDEDHEQQVA
jgi:diguanylate cyclase (GGDEF)-like protein